MVPLSILTGMAMSPALVNRFPAYARFFGGRQVARSIHFLMLAGFIGFIIVHVALVVLTALARNINHIVRGIAAHYISWYFPRGLQHAQKTIAQPVKLVTLDRLIPSEHYTQAQISAHFWPNGKMPDREDSQQLAAGNFKEFRLRVGVWWRTRSNGSLEDLRAFGKDEFITMHHCIQGWSGIAQWGGFSMKKLIEHVKPKPSARVIAFYSFGGSLYGGSVLRHAEPLQRAQAGVSTRLRDEGQTVDGRLWCASAAAGRESTRLQEGQMDRTH